MNVLNRVVALARLAIRFEIGVWRSLYFLVRRRDPGASPRSERFTYVKAVELIYWVFIIVSAIEVPIAHMLVPWEPVKYALLALGFWGLMWMIGMLAAYKVHTHLVEPAALRLRNGFAHDISIPWESIASVAIRERTRGGSRGVQLDATDGGVLLQVVVSGRTNVDLALLEPIMVVLPREAQTVTAVRFFADDPRALVKRVRTNLAELGRVTSHLDGPA
ncbi:MAG: PH domain-containing protein [Actinopolymorphaceae bacterium]